jgi:hypothetical protein
MFERLHIVVAIVWAALHAPRNTAIEDAIVTAVAEDADRGYVDYGLEAAAMAFWSAKESGNQDTPPPSSHDAWAGRSCGFLQEDCSTLPRTLLGQARKWLWLVHQGQRVCPESPLAPLSGGCSGARTMVERRMMELGRILSGPEAVASQ